MPHPVSRWLAAGVLLSLGSIGALNGCSPAHDDIVGVDEDTAAHDEGVSGSLAVGTKLVATGNVNLRSGPSTSKSILDVVPKGAVVVVTKSSPTSGFYSVEHEGTVGWSSGKFLTMPADDGATGDIASGTELVATANVNLRSGPSVSHQILDVVSKGDVVVVQGSAAQSGYYQVEHDGTVGWSKGSYYKPAGSSDPDPQPDDGEPWKCTGSFATTKVAGGKYYATSFGCWVDEDGVAHSDSGDNCIPACLSQAKADGLCAGMSGPQCERETNWYAADSGRFGCLQRLEVTNLANGKKAVVVVLDAGPACWVEKKVQAGVLDLSSRVTEYLFGGPVGTGDKAMVSVKEVSSSTPLGPK